MNKLFKSKVIFLLGSVVLISSCAKAPERELLKPEIIAEYEVGDDGVVVAETQIIGVTDAVSSQLNTGDCLSGTGYGISVNTSLENKNYLFDKNGNPCEASSTIYDGKLMVNKRAADPSVAITFVDKHGSRVEETTNEVLVIEVKGEKVEALPVDEDMVAKVREVQATNTLENTINQWQDETEHSRVLKDAEKLLAEYRNLNRMNSNELLRAHQEKIEHLMARLRQKEQELDAQKGYQKSLTVRLNSEQTQSEAERIALEQQERKLRSQLDQMSQRAREAAAINRNLREDKAEKEIVYKQRLSTLNKELQIAEVQAETARQELVLEAAKKIAEAERLAAEANMAKRHSMERAAIRMRMSAADVERYASNINNGHQIVVPALADTELPKFENGRKKAKQGLENPRVKSADLEIMKPITPLESLVVTIREEESTLRDVFNSVFKDVEDRAGKWEVYWEVKDNHMNIPAEHWTVIAEARLDEFLAYVRKRVLREQGVELRFRRFDGSRLFVISDK